MATLGQVLPACLWMSVTCFLSPGAQAQGPGNAAEQYCGRTSCRELGQGLAEAVDAATKQLEASRSELHSREIHLRSWASRAFANTRYFLEELAYTAQHGRSDTDTIDNPGPKRPTPPDDPRVSVYKVRDVKRVSSKVKRTFSSRLKKNPDSGPSIAYVQYKLDSLPITEIRPGYVESSYLDTFFDEMKSILKLILVRGPGPVNLNFKSVPVDQADIAVELLMGEPRTTRTPGRIQSLPRGLYTYKVAKDRFRRGIGRLNLIDDSREEVECHLEPSSSSQTTSCNQTGGSN